MVNNKKANGETNQTETEDPERKKYQNILVTRQQTKKEWQVEVQWYRLNKLEHARPRLKIQGSAWVWLLIFKGWGPKSFDHKVHTKLYKLWHYP